jgi:hypothetical protein
VERFEAALRERFPEAVIEHSGDLELRVVRPPGNDTRIVWLGRAYKEFCDTPAEADEIISRHLRSVAAVGSAALDPDRIIPVIKNREWLAVQGASLSQGGRGLGFARPGTGRCGSSHSEAGRHRYRWQEA